MRNDLPMKSMVNECGVLNLNDSTQNGSHWVAWKKMKNKKIYFDSFGINPLPKEFVNYLGKHNLWYTDRKFQDYNDPPICGHLTKNINATKIQTVNGRWRISTKCFICKTNKSKFIKAPEIEHSNNSIISNKKLNDTDKLLLAKELHKPVRKRFPKRRIITHGIDDLWAILFPWAFPLKKKDGISVSKAFEKIIEQAKTQNHQTPKLLHADKGLEFENKHFKNVLKKYSIHMYHTQNEEKSAIIERFNRTLNGKMRLCFEVQKSKKWINILQNLLDEYNFKDIHRSIGMKPCEVNKSNEDDVLHKLFSTKNKPKPKIKFSVCDRVRIKAYKKTFVKENNIINKDNKKNCDKCNLTIGYKNWSAHLKSIRHGKNDIDQTIVPFRFNRTYKGNDQFGNGNPYISKLLNSPTWLELCKIANDLIITGDYTHHYLDNIKIIEDLGNIKMFKRNVNNNKMDNKKTYPNKTCDKCNLTVSYKNWSRHLKSIRHQTNDVDQTIKPKFNKTYKGIPTKQIKTKKEKITKPHKVFNFSARIFEKKDNRPILETKETAFENNVVIGRLKKALRNKNLKVNIMFLAIYKRGSEENIEYKELEDFVMKNSQWRLYQILSLGININKYVPFKGSLYIPLPENIQNKHAIINVKNEDDKCFLWAILSALHPVKKHAKRVKDISINIYYLEEKRNNTHIIVPLEITKIEKTNHIDLMYLREDYENKGHYCWINDLWKLVGSQMTKDGHRRLICKMCLNSFNTENKLNYHIHYCGNNKAAKIVLPKPYNKTLEFENNDDYKPPVEYSGPNVAKEFFNCIQNEEIAVSEIYDEIIPMKVMNKRQQYHYNNSVKCHICERFLSELPPRLEKKLKIYVAAIEHYKQLNDDDNICLYKSKIEEAIKYKKLNMKKVCDHDHLTGEYRGAAHSICNLTYKNPKFIPIVCHNLSGYDAHLFIKQFGNDNNDITLIPNNEEKYISFSKIIERTKYIKGEEIILKTELRFIDSFKFLSSSLDKLTNYLEKHQFKDLSKYFPEEHLNLVTRKLAYPYEYMDCEEKFNETCLPPREKFYSSLTGKNITIEKYENSQKIWEVFNIKNMREFTSLYNKIDVLLLTDIMENFRDISLKKYKLDPLWYYTTPGFAWDCMLRMTKVKLDLLTDIDQILMFESGIRGGLSQCKESIFLQYLGANNLYGRAMSKYLPTGDFKWVNNLNNFDVMGISDESPKGYILEVDLSYSKELHDLHSDFPLAPEKHFDDEQLPKLLTSLKIMKIHRVLEFSQSPWLKLYIDFNTDLRSKAKNEFEKDYFKLMNNSVYARTMMNVRNHVDIRLCSNEAKLEKLIVKPNFDRRTIFTENLAAIHMKRTEIFIKQPIYIDMCILDLFKSLMYDFYYNTIKEKYGNRVRLLYTDTDSLILEIKTDDFYQNIKINLDHFDTSDYPKDNIYDLPLVNKKVLGKFKDELNGKIMTEFIGLRSKLYSHRILDSEKEIKKSKGVKKNVVENKLCFDDFKNCLLTKKPKYVRLNLFRTKKHDVFTVEQNKKALSVYDDKRFILDNGIDTLA
ncbi:hypothetical protein AGLY_011971 [Aphis glycines]|uniref:Integrase catalytic domain-containing protein n=1 Tax=Aphis glycines TaxID=307491 RepID=A0A6G0TBC3_APHGL|nr:hypothetical protein AGLY_011971 [Aphis glycines]